MQFQLPPYGVIASREAVKQSPFGPRETALAVVAKVTLERLNALTYPPPPRACSAAASFSLPLGERRKRGEVIKKSQGDFAGGKCSFNCRRMPGD